MMRKCLPLFLMAFLALGATGFAKDVKVGFIYVSPVGDAGYSYAHDQGRLAVESMDGVTTSFVESVAEGQDSERVMMNMARKGYDIIFATSYGYMDPMLKVAKEFPDTKFLHCSGYKNAPNMANYFGRIYQARYLTGMVAGAMTKSKELGYVAAFPIPEVIRGINAFTLGAQAVNPDVKVRVVWTKTWAATSSPSTRIPPVPRKPHRNAASTPWATTPT
jgi:basic membrane protein A